jgi:phosphoglycolate phosphatase-like HAD superfamily hydrolase
LYIGDAPCDVAAARASKCRIVAVSYGYTAQHVLAQAQPDDIVDSLTGIMTLGLRSPPSVRELRVVS